MILGLVGVVLIVALLFVGLSSTGLFLAASGEQKVLVGVSLPLSGKLSTIGVPIKQGIMDSFGDSGDKVGKYSIQLIIEDDAADIAKAVSNYQYFKSTGANSFFVALTRLGAAINPESKKDKKIMMYFGTSVDIPKSNPYAFKHHYNVINESNEIFKIIGDYSSALIYNAGDHGEEFKEILVQKAGPKVRGSFVFQNTETDFRQIIIKLKEQGVETPIFFGYPSNLFNFVKQSKELGYEPKYLGIIANTYPEVVNGIEQYYNGKTTYVFTSPFEETNFDYVFGYQAAELLQYGMNKCLGKALIPDDPECLKNTMINIDFNGKYGKIKTDQYGIVDVGAKLYTIKDKKLVPFEAS